MTIKNVALQANGGVATADSYSGSNLPTNANNGLTLAGNGSNWYGGTKLMVQFDKMYTIDKVRIMSTNNWGSAFNKFDLYYTTSNTVTVNSLITDWVKLGSFENSQADYSGNFIEQTFNPVIAKSIMIVPNMTGMTSSLPAIVEFEVYSSTETKYLVRNATNEYFTTKGEKIGAMTDSAIIKSTFKSKGSTNINDLCSLITTANKTMTKVADLANGSYYSVTIGQLDAIGDNLKFDEASFSLSYNIANPYKPIDLLGESMAICEIKDL